MSTDTTTRLAEGYPKPRRLIDQTAEIKLDPAGEQVVYQARHRTTEDLATKVIAPGTVTSVLTPPVTASAPIPDVAAGGDRTNVFARIRANLGRFRP